MLKRTMNESEAQLRIKQLENQLCLTRREVNNLRQQLKSLNYVHKKECEDITKRLENWRCENCRQQEARDDNAAEARDSNLNITEIGTIYSNFPEKRGTPRQPGICAEVISKLVLNNDVFTNPNHALEGLQEFSHIWILFYFHKNDSTHTRAKVAPPRLNGIRTGVFATRSPHRPSPIGLSLVKIERIVGNIIYFSGVDMIDQTPVLDIKPYIPQYDNPVLLMNSFEETDTIASTSNNNEPGTSSSSSSITMPPIENLNIRTMDGEENNQRENVVGAVSSESTVPQSTVDELLYTRLNSRIGEREAPDGEEEESPNNAFQTFSHISIPTTPEGHIRVPSWIDQPPVSTLTVTFKDRAIVQLNQLGSEGEEKKTIIENVLKEDPRSVYLRERWGSHCYVFRIAELCVSCKFNDAAHSVTVYQVFKNGGADGDE